MKGLTRAALEKVRCIERENMDLRASKELVGLGLEPRVVNRLLSMFLKEEGARCSDDDRDVKSSIEALISELKSLRESNARLIAHVQLLRVTNGTGCIKLQEDVDLRSQYLGAIAEAREYKPTIAKLQAQITAMEFDWTQAKQLRDELFDYDDKLREHRMVEDALCLRVPNKGAEVFATSRRQMLEILVEDRNRNINGYYARRVIPLEQLRLEKDTEIAELRRQVRMYELQSGISTDELRTIQVPDWVNQACAAETRCRSVTAKCHAEEAKLEALQRAVQHYEDHAREWKTAHDQAASMISKAERMRSEYDGLMAKLKEEDQRILAKKKELEEGKASSSSCGGRGKAVDLHARYARLREISEETDEAEGEIAAKELALKRLRVNIAARERALQEEHKALQELEERIKAAVHQRRVSEAKERNRGSSGSSSAMEEDDTKNDDDDLSTGFSSVCV